MNYFWEKLLRNFFLKGKLFFLKEKLSMTSLMHSLFTIFLTDHKISPQQNFSSISYRVHRIIVVAVLSISDIIYAVIHCMEHREPQIAIPSHIAGALCGILLGFIFYESHRHENREGNLLFKVLKWTSMAFLLCFVAFVVAINVIAV